MNGLVFPGQGSQSIGMAKFLFDEFSSVKNKFEEASEAVSVDFQKLLFEGPAEKLNLTENTQPALVLASVSYFTALKQECEFDFIASSGHSLGEYSALVCAGSLNFTDAIKAVKARGKAMQEAVPVGEGAMLAVMGMENEHIVNMCKWVEQESGHAPLQAANFNAPGQVVISGKKEACDWLLANFDKEKFGNPRRHKFIPLKVSAPFHCPMMMPAQEKMQEVLSTIEILEPISPVVQNVSAKDETAPESIKSNLIEQVSAPVRWIECTERLKELGCKNLFEMGPGKVISGLVKKIDSEAFTTFNMQSMDEFKEWTKLLGN